MCDPSNNKYCLRVNLSEMYFVQSTKLLHFTIKIWSHNDQ